jgi:hypothetical protein
VRFSACGGIAFVRFAKKICDNVLCIRLPPQHFGRILLILGK